jgi:sugar lactone lactonase YvrE
MSPASGVVTPKGEASFANPPANFYAFSSARVGEPSRVESVWLRFDAATTIQSIKSTPDFPIEQGGSCVEGQSYAKGDTCIVLVRFTPQGAGRRLGKLKVAHAGSAEPAAFGLGGYGYAAVVSFTPALITTVPGTYPASKGLLSGAQNLTVDGSDTLFIADTGNGIIRYDDSSATIVSLATGYSSPNGIAVDTFGEVYFGETAANRMYEIFDYGPVVPASGSTISSCTVSAPCTLGTTQIYLPGEMSMDPYNHLFFVEETRGAAMSTVQPEPANLVFLYDPFPYQNSPSTAMAVDANDNLYSLWSTTGNCEIQQQSLYNSENNNVFFTKVAGGRICGYSGDGGEAGNAEIGSLIGQIAFDVSGNLYFTDTNNQRVRMINVTTGIISTVAGSGTAGYAGDGGQGTSAKLSYPTGVTVDSQGQVYIISGTGTVSGGAQVIRKLGVTGQLGFGNQPAGTAGAAHIVTVSNTGNSSMTLTNTAFTGANPGDFSVDPATTSCVLTAGASLYSGQSCKIGFIFKPGATGARSAGFVMLDNTVTNSNTVQLSGTGTSSAVKLNPGAVSFPATAKSYTTTVPVTITNSGNAALTLSSIALAGTNAAMFSSTSGCGTSVAPGVTCTLHVTFKPSATGSYAASLKVTDNAPNSPQSIALKGSGVAAVASTVKLAAAANPATTCQPVSFAVTVGGTGAGTPTGTITLKNGATVLATGALSKGTAALSTEKLAAGTSQLTASYGGDATHEPSASAELAQTVNTGACTEARTQTLGAQP